MAPSGGYVQNQAYIAKAKEEYIVQFLRIRTIADSLRIYQFDCLPTPPSSSSSRCPLSATRALPVTNRRWLSTCPPLLSHTTTVCSLSCTSAYAPIIPRPLSQSSFSSYTPQSRGLFHVANPSEDREQLS